MVSERERSLCLCLPLCLPPSAVSLGALHFSTRAKRPRPRQSLDATPAPTAAGISSVLVVTPSLPSSPSSFTTTLHKPSHDDDPHLLLPLLFFPQIQDQGQDQTRPSSPGSRVNTHNGRRLCLCSCPSLTTFTLPPGQLLEFGSHTLLPGQRPYSGQIVGRLNLVMSHCGWEPTRTPACVHLELKLDTADARVKHIHMKTHEYGRQLKSHKRLSQLVAPGLCVYAYSLTNHRNGHQYQALAARAVKQRR